METEYREFVIKGSNGCFIKEKPGDFNSKYLLVTGELLDWYNKGGVLERYPDYLFRDRLIYSPSIEECKKIIDHYWKLNPKKKTIYVPVHDFSYNFLDEEPKVGYYVCVRKSANDDVNYWIKTDGNSAKGLDICLCRQALLKVKEAIEKVLED